MTAASGQLARRIAAIADEKRASDIVALDVSGLVSYTDVVIVCTARNERQTKAIVDGVRAEMKLRHAVAPVRIEGTAESRWVLMDYLDCVLHVFVPETRETYRIEQLWGEAPAVELELEGDGARAATA